MANLLLYSYNSTGFNFQKIEFVNFLLTALNIDIFCLQEHFLLKSNSHIIQNEFPDYNVSIVPATKSDAFISKGRPSGGLFILWKKALNSRISIVKTENNRVQTIQIDERILLFNCYFPYDTRDQNFNDWELQKCLNDIDEICLNFPNHSVIVAGDLNCEYNRNTPFVNSVRDWTIQSCLFSAWWKYPIDFTFSNFSFNRPSFSIIDHFLFNNIAETIIKEAGVSHFGNNLSNHSPIYLKIESLPLVKDSGKTNLDNNPKIYKPNWNKAKDHDVNNYKNDLDLFVKNIDITEGLICSDVHCKDLSHRNHICNYMSKIFDVIEDATVKNIPPICAPHEKKLPGWSQFVQPLKDEAIFYHAIWISYGKPVNCGIHFAMKQSRNRYHYAIRKIKNNLDAIKNDKFLEYNLNKNPQEFLKEFKKMKNLKNPKVNNIDGHDSDYKISQHFANNYKDLYNKSDSKVELQNEYNYLDSIIVPSDICNVEIISPSLINQIISKLDKQRNDSMYCFKSDALCYGSEILSKYLAILFQSALIHGFLPKDILCAKLQPIVKDKLGSKNDSSNYRAIGISSLFLKILDLTLLHIFQNSLQVSDNQFGFQVNCSTTFCTFTVKESINYFLNRNTPVFSCFLDMTKAFDLVNYDKLFKKLRDRISPIFLRLLCYIYLNQTACVVWGNCISDKFSVNNGVKQGAILSPTLFSIYIDDLFDVLKQSGFGCFIDDMYYGAIAYADDIVLSCPNPKGLQKMLDITKNFFDDIDLIISYNFDEPAKSKTKCMAFGVKNNPEPILLNGCPIPWVNKFKHLGHILYKDGNSFHDTVQKKNIFIGKFHSLCQLLKNKDPVVYIKLIQVYLIDFYGSNLWNFYDNATAKFYTSWNRMIRNVFNLPYNSHRYLIEPISGIPHLKCMIINRFIKFYNSILKCNKSITKHIAFIQALDCRSDFGRNIQNICNETKVFNFSDITRENIKYFPASPNDEWKVNILKELLNPNKFDIIFTNRDVNLSNMEIKLLVDFLSTS